MLRVESVEDTISIIIDNFSDYTIASELIELNHSSGRVVTSDIYSNYNIPDFDRSTVDGYSIVASDSFGTSDSIPAEFKVVGSVAMGDISHCVVESGKAVYTPTGASIPDGADGVVMIEYADELSNNVILVNKSISPGENIIKTGSDIKKGSLVVKQGTVLKSIHLGLLASIGVSRVEVRKKIKAGIIITGDEIISPECELKKGQIRNSNGYFLYGALIEMGVEPVNYGIIEDNYDSILTLVQAALENCDMVILTGGSSVGLQDHTSKVIDALGTPGVLVHGISVKPGKPTIIGKSKGKPVIGLPGHPAAVVTITNYFVRKIIDVMQSNTTIPQSIHACMGINYGSNNGRAEFLPVQLQVIDNQTIAYPITGRSFQLFNLAQSDGFIVIPSDCEGLAQGAEVTVYAI
ncbi:MAG: hypothetical protein A2015_13235 [Spirochaetes bacterium GWF1_31_7]|nr:MAG: hypothetical protein A2Y30_00640 [Spirochaetes bacterium GWE1_32_154]OHD51542.1 MAG: hypothetical protein A2015_13235 [Spirochaetes bacterium GWF1_31_7]OHD52515.1 MAG: hypothetical protein A2Y29_15130 [Spirochaetes bacterium GWE2_31_10]OHD77390.1 MAG: hypothetical protein A2355_01335 [Spirochaetes bacterium RIFOXYB1_FULL_32_8]HBD94050.1 molybdopterin molybdenumtransferase MoeA [Spirochaetia bacterium]